jgi:hypothetical protein
MPARTVVLTALVASCASSLVTLAVALLVLAPSIRAAPDPQAVQPIVRAERFELVNANGMQRVMLGVDGQGLALTLRSPDNQPRIVLRVTEDDASIVGVTNAARTGAALYALPDGRAIAAVQGPQDRGDVLMQIAADNTREIKIFDKDDRLVWQAP